MREVLFAIVLAGCGGSTPDSDVKPDGTVVAAITQQATQVRVAFASAANTARLSDVIAGQNPHDFDWVRVSVPIAAASAGTHLDMSNVAAGAQFAQVYPEVCNPALQDNSSCQILESYSAGDPGMTGTGYLKVTASTAEAQFDISWQGITDRFGSPSQYYQHGSTIAYLAPIVMGAAP